MPQSLDNVLLHIIFSTKGRAPWLSVTVRHGLHAYLASVTRNNGCECYRAGGTSDHVHLAVRLARTVTIAALVESLKVSSARWPKAQSPEHAQFAWQRGYGVFAVSPSHRDILLSYIDDQMNHHQTRSFEEEYRSLLARYGIAYDERYVWD